jgi:hypothetical protein
MYSVKRSREGPVNDGFAREQRIVNFYFTEPSRTPELRYGVRTRVIRVGLLRGFFFCESSHYFIGMRKFFVLRQHNADDKRTQTRSLGEVRKCTEQRLSIILQLIDSNYGRLL